LRSNCNATSHLDASIRAIFSSQLSSLKITSYPTSASTLVKKTTSSLTLITPQSLSVLVTMRKIMRKMTSKGDRGKDASSQSGANWTNRRERPPSPISRQPPPPATLSPQTQNFQTTTTEEHERLSESILRRQPHPPVWAPINYRSRLSITNRYRIIDR
jgi:hypothetical protein